MGFLKALLVSRKFWLMIGACVSAAVTGHPGWIPGIIMGNVGAITVEDAAHKLGLRVPERPDAGDGYPAGEDTAEVKNADA